VHPCVLGLRQLEQLVEPAGGLRHDVRDEGQGRGVADPGLPTDLAAQHALGALERRRAVGASDLVAEHRVEERGLPQVGREPRVGDGHHAEARVLDLLVEGLGHDLADPDGELARPCDVDHRSSSGSGPGPHASRRRGPFLDPKG
jgi:hypothetical protein